MDLELIKNYLHIDADITDEDDQLKALAASAASFIEKQTGKHYDEQDALMRFAVQLLVSHWYTNRTALSKANVQEYPYSLRAVLYSIELDDSYQTVAEYEAAKAAKGAASS